MYKEIYIFKDKIRKYYHKTIFSFIFLLLSLTSFATELPNHYIIAFDRSIPRYRQYYESSEILKLLDATLKENNFNYKQDYISIVGYTMDYVNPSIDKYVRAYSNNGTPIIWYKLERENILELFPDWTIGHPVLDYYNSIYGSMQSLAKPYSVIETRTQKNSVSLANRTFLYMITDEEVNGTDDNYQQEWKRASECYGSNYSMFNKVSDDVFSTLQMFNEEFKFLQIQLNRGNSTVDKISISADGVYKIVPYEVVSVDRPSVYAITDMPSPLPLQRVKGGFLLKIDTHSLLEKYIIKDISILTSDGQLLGSSDSGKLELFIPSEKVNVGDVISLSLTVTLKDGLYDGVIISPANTRYHDGMAVNQVVKIQNEAKILGILPLSDSFWWWFPNDIFSAVMIWDLVILLILIFIVGYIFYRFFVRINTYNPANDKIKINKTK